MAKLKKAKSSKKLSFSDLGLEPKPIFELDDLNYKQRKRKSKKNSINSDDNENEISEKEMKLMTKSELKKAEKKRKSLNKNKNKSEEQSMKLTENDELKMIRELSKKIGKNSNDLKSSIKDGSDDKEVKSNSFLSLEDSFRSVSEYNNSLFDTDSSDSSSSSDHEDLLDIVEDNNEKIVNCLKQHKVVVDHRELQEKNDTYENLFDEILDDKVKKEKELASLKKNDDIKEKDIVGQVINNNTGNVIKTVNSSLSDMDLSTKKEDNQDSIQKVSKSEAPSPKKFSKRKMLYSLANSVWDYVKPVSLDELERKQSESKNTEDKNKDNRSELVKNQMEKDDANTEEMNNSKPELKENKICKINEESHDNKMKLDQVENMKRSKSQEIISHLVYHDKVNDEGILNNSITKLSNSHSGSLISTPIKNSKRQIIYNFANSIWDYVKPVSLDELEERKKTNKELNVDSTKLVDELKKNSLSDEVSDSEFYIQDTEEEEDNEEEKKVFGFGTMVIKEENMNIGQGGGLENEESEDKNQINLCIIHEVKKEDNQEQIFFPLVESVEEGKKDDQVSVTLVEDREKERAEKNNQSQIKIVNPEIQLDSLDIKLSIDPVEKVEVEKENLEKKQEDLEEKEENLEDKEKDLEDKKENLEERKEEKKSEKNEEDASSPDLSLRENKEDEKDRLSFASKLNFSKGQEEVDQINMDSTHLDNILEDIATDSNIIMDELSQISLGKKQDHENIIQIPDLSEIYSIQEIIDSNRLDIFQGKVEKLAEKEHLDIDHENQVSMESSLNEHHPIIKEEETHLTNLSHFDNTQKMVERMEDEILNTNLNIDEYNELFDNLHTNISINSDEYNMNSLDNQVKEKDSHFNDQLQQDLHKDHHHLYRQVSIQEVDDSLFMSISSDQFLFENTMLVSEKQVRNQHTLKCSFQALECCSEEDYYSTMYSNSKFKMLKTHHNHIKTNNNKKFNKLYRIENKLNRKIREISSKISLFSQETEKISKIRVIESNTKKVIDWKVTLVNIKPGSSIGTEERPSFDKVEGFVIKEEILPFNETSNTKTLLDASVNTEVIQKFNNYHEKAINTNSDQVEVTPTTSTSFEIPKTSHFLEKDKKVDSIFRNEIYKILDNTRLIKKAQKLKSGYANTDQVEMETDHNFKYSTNPNIKYNRERYAKPGNNRYDIVTQEASRRYIKDYPESNSEESIRVFRPNNNNIQKNLKNNQLFMQNTQEYNYKYKGTNHISPRSLSPDNNNNYHSYYLRSNSNSPSLNYSNIQAFGNNINTNNNHNINSSSYYYNGGNTHTQIKYPEYFNKPNNRYADELGGSNYHTNYYCGRPGRSEEVKRYIYVDGLTNKNQRSFYLCPPGQARN
ncbi:uncharacterized protein ELE39_002769 [Cryptosporidium sp. chipmunk genotype I]|uniref:uncharacterized protein n=1 Tax=Cryptosporidium sp. chipmunk genotype I TaxID=1280935 RepID=UPI00351A0A43|nr:hypothetical protein ELE39_002769 [Cryptosporidium sp. chipmunk genotype I]